MITDRTLNDVSIANALRLKIQSGQTLAESELEAFERGACTTTMLNRIENKQKELALLLNKFSYTISITNKTWTNTQIFKHEDYLRILNNLEKLKNAFFTIASTPETPTYLYGYTEANDVEKILVDIENELNQMKTKFRQCGTFNCGEENGL